MDIPTAFTVQDLTTTGHASELLARYLTMLTDDAVIELHGLPADLPTRLTGRAEIETAVARLADLDLRVTELAAAEPLLDPATWLVFARGELISRSTGAHHRQGYVFALRLRGNLISHCACYRDPLADAPADATRRRGLLAPLGGIGLRRRRRGQAPTDRL